MLPFVTRSIGLEGILLSETSQAEKDYHCMVSLTYGSKSKKRVKLTETESRKVGWVWRKEIDVDKKVPTFCCKIIRFKALM